MEGAVFRKEEFFHPANLQKYLPFWDHEILKDHPHQSTILGWLTGVKIEEFLNYFTTTVFQGQDIHSYYPQQREFENDVPSEYQDFMNEQVQELVNMGVLKKWTDVTSASDIPLHNQSWKLFGVGWKGVYYVVTVLLLDGKLAHLSIIL